MQHVEVPGPGVKSELWLLAFTTTKATSDQSHIYDLHHSSQQCQILNPLSEARDQTTSSWILVRFLTFWATMGIPLSLFFFFKWLATSMAWGSSGAREWTRSIAVTMLCSHTAGHQGSPILDILMPSLSADCCASKGALGLRLGGQDPKPQSSICYGPVATHQLCTWKRQLQAPVHPPFKDVEEQSERFE